MVGHSALGTPRLRPRLTAQRYATQANQELPYEVGPNTAAEQQWLAKLNLVKRPTADLLSES